ncbi:MAG: hypothetical protein V4580_09490 [Bacteroidota bacterium]
MFKKNSSYSDIALVAITVFSICATVFFVNWGASGNPFVMDVNQYYSYLPAVFINYDLSFSENLHSYWLIETPIHQLVPKVTYGIAFFYSPFFLLAQAFSPANSVGYESTYAWFVHYGCIFYILIGFFYTKKILSLWFKDKVVAISLAIVFFATNLFYYTVSESESVHGILFFLVAFFLYHVVIWHKKKSVKSFLLFMVSAGFICLIRPTECMLFLFPLLIGVVDVESLKEKFKNIMRLKWILLVGFLLFALPIMPQLVYWKIHSGSFLFFSYGNNEGFFWTDPKLMNVLFSFKKGWLIYTPVMIFSVIGFSFMFRKNKILFYPTLFYFLINVYVVCSWWDWAYGGSFGMRAFIHCYAVLIMPLAYFIDGVIGLYKKSMAKTALVYGFALLGLFFCTLNIFQSNLYKHHIIHWDGMTREAYMFTFFKKKYTEQDFAYLKVVIKSPDYAARRKGERDE